MAFPRRHRLSLPLWKTQWWLSPGGTGYPCRCGKLNEGFPPTALATPAAVVPEGGCFFGRLSPLPLAYLSAPFPPSPRSQSALPRRGRGRPKLFFARGFAPCIPSIRPPAALVRPAAVENSMAAFPRRHWLALPRGRGPSQTPKFLSPGPPSPWLPALHIGNHFLPFWQRTAGSAPGCRGRSPLHKKTKISPFPAGEERSASAGRGDRGQESKLKAG